MGPRGDTNGTLYLKVKKTSSNSFSLSNLLQEITKFIIKAPKKKDLDDQLKKKDLLIPPENIESSRAVKKISYDTNQVNHNIYILEEI